MQKEYTFIFKNGISITVNNVKRDLGGSKDED